MTSHEEDLPELAGVVDGDPSPVVWSLAKSVDPGYCVARLESTDGVGYGKVAMILNYAW